MMPPSRRRAIRIIVVYCSVGAIVLGAFAQSGILLPPTMWATVGAALLGAWVGLALYRLRSDALF